MSKKAWIIFAAICVAVLGSLVYVSSKNKVDVSNVNAEKPLAATAESGNIADHVFGKPDSKVVLVEYGDFQCPGCGSVHPTVKTLTEKYKDQITFVFRNFPLTSIHPNAKAAAAAVEAAGKQNKYWEMHNVVFEQKSEWENAGTDQRTGIFAGLAGELGLNTDTFKADMTSADINKKISFDMAIGKKDGVDSTPTFYLNGTVLTNAVWGDDAAFEKAITDELKKNGIALPEEK